MAQNCFFFFYFSVLYEWVGHGGRCRLINFIRTAQGMRSGVRTIKAKTEPLTVQ